jgi:hypothetical protein
MIVDSRATTGLPEATASLMRGLMRTRELNGRILGNSFAVAHVGRIIQNILDPVRRGGRGFSSTRSGVWGKAKGLIWSMFRVSAGHESVRDSIETKELGILWLQTIKP